jgi:hypothetical protein
MIFPPNDTSIFQGDFSCLKVSSIYLYILTIAQFSQYII